MGLDTSTGAAGRLGVRLASSPAAAARSMACSSPGVSTSW